MAYLLSFPELYDKLRQIAEANRQEGYPLHFLSFSYYPYGPGPKLQTWTLQPEHIETLVTEISRLQEENQRLKDWIRLVPIASQFKPKPPTPDTP